MNLVLETDRLVLKPLAEGDVDLCIEMFTDPEVMKYIREPSSRAEVIEKMPIRCRRGGGGSIGVWCVTDRATGERLGTSVLIPLPINRDDTDWSLLDGPKFPPGEIEVGYILKPSAWGRGVATEVCSRLLKFAFEETPLKEVVAVTDPENTASKNVLTKCGLSYEGTRRAYNYDDVPAFRINKADWTAGADCVTFT